MIAFVGQTGLCVQARIGPSTLRTRTLAATARGRVCQGLQSFVPIVQNGAGLVKRLYVRLLQVFRRQRAVHDAKGILPQCPAWTLRQEYVDACLTLATFRLQERGGRTMGQFTVVYTTVVEDILKRVMLIAAQLRGNIGRLGDATVVAAVSVKVVREAAK